MGPEGKKEDERYTEVGSYLAQKRRIDPARPRFDNRWHVQARFGGSS
jgi:hypothetical protein